MSKRGRDTPDQRSNFRIPTNLPCEIRSGGITGTAVLLNISLSGALISSRLTLPNGYPVLISIKLPELKEAVPLQGYAVHVTPDASDWQKEKYWCGVRFHNLPGEFLKFFNLLAAKKESRFRVANV